MQQSNPNQTIINNDDANDDSIRLSALHSLIDSVGEGILPKSQTMPLAQRILTSSISTASSSSSSLLSSSSKRTILRRIERHYKKQIQNTKNENDNDNDNDNIPKKIQEIDHLYEQLKSETKNEEMSLGVLKVLSRLVGTNQLLTQEENTYKLRRHRHAMTVDYDNGNDGDGNGHNHDHDPTFITATATATATVRPKPSDGNDIGMDKQLQSQHETTFRSIKHISLAIEHEEQNILRECIHALQYINGDLIRFYEKNDNQHTDKDKDEDEDNNETMLGTINTKEEMMNKYQGIRIRPGLLPFNIDPHTKVQTKSTRIMSSGSYDALRICGEAGWLYSRIQSYIQSIEHSNHHTGTGVVPRSLASSLRKELDSYHTLLSSLESKFLHNNGNASSKNLTCRHLMIQLREPTTQLRTIAMMIDGISTQLKGGQVLTHLYLHSMHGDKRHQSLVNQILYSTSLPWYDLLYDWCMNGVLSSSATQDEFFIQEVGGGASTTKSNQRQQEHTANLSKKELFQKIDDNLWHGHFVLVQDQIPFLPSIGRTGGIMTQSLANEILIVGKGINFIRRCLHDSQWTFDLRTFLSRHDYDQLLSNAKHSSSGIEMSQQVKRMLGFQYDFDNGDGSSTKPRRFDNRRDLSGQCGEIISQSALERTVSIAAQQVHKHILTSLVQKHHLLQHLKGLKEILFLGQGDFISSLLDGLHTEFESHNGIDEIYMHNMTGILYDAIRNTNAKFLPSFVLQRVHIKLLSAMDVKSQRFWIDMNDSEEKAKNEAIELDGWDIFSLCYDIDAPLTAVVHPDAMEKYYKVFNLLFRLKRIDWMLNSTWRQSTVLNHALRLMISKYGDVALRPTGTSSTKHSNDLARMKQLLRTFAMTRHKMVHFISNLQSYLMFEVLESGWKDLVSKLQSSRTLDEVISAHNEYLDEIVIKSLLDNVTKKSEEDGRSYELEKQLRLVLTTAYRFCKSHELIFGDALQSIDKAAEKRRGAERRSKAGKWGFDKLDPDVEGLYFYKLCDDKTLLDIMNISQDFDTSLRYLLSMLNEKINGSVTNAVMNTPFKTPIVSMADSVLARNNDSLRFLTFRLDFSEFYSV